jgi:peptidyl-prolyl cis-trans isomerase D
VVDELRRRLVIERAVDDMLAFSETVEDERAAGSSLEEIGQRFDLEVATFENFDRNGTLSDGSRATPLRSFDGLIDNLFESLIGEDLPMLETADGSFVWARLSDIQPSRVPPLADVRAQAIAQWKVSEKAKLLEALAEHLVSQGNNQDSFSKITKGLNLTPLTSDPMTRQVSNETFSTQAVEKLFTLEENKFAWARAGFGSDLVVMQALNITQAKPSDSSEARDLIFSGELRKYHADITDQLIRSLQSTYGIEIFEDNLEQALTQLVAR